MSFSEQPTALEAHDAEYRQMVLREQGDNDVKKLETALGIAVNQRGRLYEKIFGVFVRYESDDTGAKTDVEAFISVLHRVTEMEEITIILDDKLRTPTWYINEKMQPVFQHAISTEGRVLVIFHYIGHGQINALDHLEFAGSEKSKPFSWKYINTRLCNPDADSDEGAALLHTDVVAILDCCYAGAAGTYRSLASGKRSVELLCAVKADQTAYGNVANRYLKLKRTQNTFTAKLTMELSRAIGQNAIAICWEELAAAAIANSKVCIPAFERLHGWVPIKIMTKSAGTTSRPSSGFPTGTTAASSNLPQSGLRAVFAVHFSNDYDDEEVQQVVKWIQSLDPGLGIELMRAHRSGSTSLLFDTPLTVYNSVNIALGASLCYSYTGNNLLPKLPSTFAPSCVADRAGVTTRLP